MSKARYNVPRAAIHVGAPAKSFSAAEGYESERRGWDENTYRLKNQDTNNHYDFSRKHLNFEINNKGEIVPLCSDPVPLHERLQKRLDELDFKLYMDKNNPLGISDNSPNCTVGIIVSGDRNVLTRLAFGDQDVDFTLQKSNAHVVLKQGIKDWALDTYHWACDRWGAGNIIGFDVHLDETTPHIHIQTIPVAKTKARGRASVKYVHKDDKSKILSHKEWKELPEEIPSNFVRTEVERREKECVSYARVWGEDKYAVGKTYYQMHTDYYNEVGRKYGLERGDDIAMLPGEERRERVHKNKAVLEAERQAKDAIVRTQMENERMEGQKEKMASEVQDMRKQKESLEGEVDKMEGQIRSVEQQKRDLEGSVSQLEEYAAALDIKEEDLIVPTLNTNLLVKNAWDDIKEELAKPIPTFGHKKWKKERKQAIKTILTELQTALMEAKEAHNKDILKLGKSLFNKAMKEAGAIIEQNKQLQKENARLIEENNGLKKNGLLRLTRMPSSGYGTRRMQKSKTCRSNLAKPNLRLFVQTIRHTVSTNEPKTQRAKSEKCLTFPKSRKFGRTFSRTRKPSGSRLTNGLKMALQLSRIMQMAKTTTSNQSRATLLHGASSPRHLSVVLTQLMKNNAG